MTEQDAEQQTEHGEPEPVPGQKTDPVRRWTLILLAVALLLLVTHLRADRFTPYTSQARLHALVVPVASEVSGSVVTVGVSSNQAVVAGQELFSIDRERYELAVQTAEANLEAARQAMGASAANVESARASLASAKANLERSSQDYERLKRIVAEDPGAVSQRRLDSAEASRKISVAQLAAAEAGLKRAIQDLGQEGEENSRIIQAQAALDQARIDLDKTVITAPADGVVTDVRIDRGNFAAAGAPQMTFIGTGNVWVQADFTENNLGHVEPGDKVEILFDAIPGAVFSGTVRDIG
jgi:multidrug resistance efflux pump